MRFEGIEIVGSHRTRIEPADSAKADAVDAARIVVHSREVCPLNAVNPEREAAVIGASGSCSAPVYFHIMGRVVNGKPACTGPARLVIAQCRAYLIGTRRTTDFDSQNICRGTGIPVEDVMSISISHGDGIWIEIETSPIPNFGIRHVIGHIDRGCIIDDRPQTPASDQRCQGADI